MTLSETARLCMRLYSESDRVSQSQSVSDGRSREPKTSESGANPTSMANTPGRRNPAKVEAQMPVHTRRSPNRVGAMRQRPVLAGQIVGKLIPRESEVQE
jgi:hypothetical protein